MIHKSDRNDRRILTLTAVRPCESVASTTLLSSLIDLAQSICDDDHSRFFASQRRNARESIRLVGLVRFFLEELRDQHHNHQNHLPYAAVLCFSELHFAFQKLRFLLNDCARSGARMWILMNSKLVAGEFQSLVRLVATALDVLQLDSLGFAIDGEVNEIVELVSRQARKSRFGVDVNDQCAMGSVRSILDQFESKYEPERGLIKGVLDFLEIRSWSDCNSEVSFLEEELSRCGTGDGDRERERDAPLLSSLIALMCYCRAVIFDGHLVGEIDRADVRSVLETMNCLNPEDFRCPISLELMTDPVTVSTGQTYDRVSIQKWLQSGNPTCPKTGEKLRSKELVPNLAVKKLIQQFCVDNGVSLAKSGNESRDVSRTVLPGSPPAAEIVRFMAEFLAGRLTYGTEEQKNKAAFEVRVLAKSNVYNRIVLIDLEVIPPLLDLLTSMDPTSQENAIAALLKLSKHSTGQKSIVDSGGLGLIITTLRMGLKSECRQIAAAIIFYLTSSEKHRRFLGRSRGAIPALVELVRDGTICGKRNAMAALFGIMHNRSNREKVLTSGIVPLLMDFIACPERKELVTDALAILSMLAEEVEGSIAIIQTQGIEAVVGLMIRSCKIPKTAKEYCVSILMDVCNNGGREVVGVLVKEPSLMPQLYSVAVDGTPSASRKSRSLVNLLQRFRETSYSRLAMASGGVDKAAGVAQES